MGVLVANSMLCEDYATEDNAALMRFHIDYPFRLI